MPIALTPPPVPEVKTLGDAKAQSANKRKIICFSGMVPYLSKHPFYIDSFANNNIRL